ncbi:MAG: hypothetical protein F6J87_07885 [Spirulina sp. SIO3F2]|nr:hypothetical protein [Spirulina sp. SIO3F2]
MSISTNTINHRQSQNSVMVLPTFFLLIVTILVLGILQAIEMLMGSLGIVGAILGFGLSLPLLLTQLLLLAFLHYSCWQLLPSGYRKHNPAIATLGLCIPLFNICWSFVVFPALGEGFDRCLQNNHLEPGMDKRHLGVVYALILFIKTVTFWIPFVGNTSSLLAFIVFLLYYIDILKSAKSINRIQTPLFSSDFSETPQSEQASTPIQRLLRLAQECEGQLSFAQISMHMRLDPEETNELLNNAQRYGYAYVGNDPDTGAVRYYFDL